MIRKLRLGIVGLSKFIGQHHLSAARSIISPRVEVDHCVPGRFEHFDVNKEVALTMGFEEDRIFSELGAMLELAGAELDGVIIATPNYAHVIHCMDVARAGKHVICDKPLARNAVEADAIVRVVQKAGVKSCITPTYCGHPPLLQARYFLHGMDTVIGGRFTYDQRWLRKKQEQMGPNEGSAQAEWRRDPERSGKGGAVGDLISHLLFQIWFITGQKITAAWGDRRWVVEGLGSGKTEDQTLARIRLERGAEITLESVQYAGGHQNDNAWELWCKDGWAFGWSQREPEFLWLCQDGGPRTYLTRDDFTSPILGATRTMPSLHNDGWHDADARFIWSVASQILGCLPAGIEPFHPTVLDGRNINAVIDAIIESSDAGTPRQWVEVSWREG